MKNKGRILAIMLIISILAGLFPISPDHDHVHASDWEECSFCDHYHSDDYLCDGCGGCNENCDSNCYVSNHCHECGECFDNVLICEGCWTCENCVKICSDCHYCEDNCNSFGIEYCPNCDRCFICYGGVSCTYCNTCAECAEICPECMEICTDCADGIGFCSDCGKCQICTHDLLCEDCGECSDHWDKRCSNCHTCSNCAYVCEQCEDYCSDCSMVCPDCGKCEDCIGDEVCQICGVCPDCGILCSDCGSYCSDCAELFCAGCNTCSDCAHICIDCGNTCSDCGHMCGGCLEHCSDCADICQECGEACEYCGNMCSDCYEVCSDCVPFCKGCDECQNCRGDFCSICEEYCSSCADFCFDCGACEYCVDLCPDCEEFCSLCREVCPDCGYCEECVDICDLCGDHCSNCEDYPCEFCDISPSCQYHVFCDLCNMCSSDSDHIICPDCGEHWFAHWTRICIDEDFHQMTCTCGKALRDLETHTVRYEVVKEATETEAGLGQYYCSYRKYGCDYSRETEIPATGDSHTHEFMLWMPSWYGHKKMCACGATEGNDFAHDFETMVIEEATNDKNGLGYDKCTVCAYTDLPYIIPATNHTHNYPDIWAYDNGHHWHECSCGARDDVIWHSMGDWLTSKYPTPISAGSKERTCTVCDYKETVAIPALAGQVVVTFDSRGGSPVEEKTINNGNKVIKPDNPTKAGYDFIAWYTSDDNIDKWKFGSPVYENMILYANWEESAEGPPFILTGALDSAIFAGSYNQSLNASGSQPVEWEIITGKLPAGLSLSSDGKITGAPTETGNFSFTVKASNGNNPYDSKEYTLIVNKAQATITIRALDKKAYVGTEVPNIENPKLGVDYTVKGLMGDDELITAPALSYENTPDMTKENKVAIRISGGAPPVNENYEYTLEYKEGELNIKNRSSGNTGNDNKGSGDGMKGEPDPIEEGSAGETSPEVKPLPFTDISSDDWFADDIIWAYENGLMNGISTAAFAPGDNTTRAMIVTILHRLEGTPKSGENPFADIAEGMYYYHAVLWASENKIVNGYGDGRFGPEDSITREQMALILMNYAKFKGYDVTAQAELSKFDDGADISDWAITAVSWANAEGLLQGDGTKIMPGEYATRAQVAAIFNRFTKK